MDDHDLIDGFSLDQSRRGLDPSTVDLRRRKLLIFSRWLGARPLVDATEDDVQLFLDGRRGRLGPGLDSRTRYAWVSHLHCFYFWAMRAGYAASDPTSWITRPKLRRLLPRPIADDDLRVAISMASRRHRAILLIGAYAGFRCKEVAGLTREDVLDTYRPPRILAHGKGGKERLVPLHPEIADALRVLPMPRRGHVFVHPRTGRPMTPGQVSAEMTDFLDGLGIDERFHQLRHWFGTRVQDEVGDLRVTQELMGHASPNTTAGYAAFSDRKAVDAVFSLTLQRDAGAHRG